MAVTVTLQNSDQVAIVDDKDLELVNQYKWYLTNKGYVYTQPYLGNYKHGSLMMHRLINKTPDGMFTDHINHNKLDNRKSNLRICTNQQNSMNRNSHKNSSSKFKGVSWHPRDKKWQVEIEIAGKRFYLGMYTNEIEAAKAYDKQATELHGEFARLNFEEGK